MLKKICAHAGCNKLIDFGQTYCQQHEREHQAAVKQYKAKRNWSYKFRTKSQAYGKYGRFYHSRKWQAASLSFRRKFPLCQSCLEKGRLKASQCVDHIIPIRTAEGWKRRWDRSNWQALCFACHLRKTRSVDQGQYHLGRIKNPNNKKEIA